VNKLVNYFLKTTRYKFILISLFSILIWSALSYLVFHFIGSKSIFGDTFRAKSILYKIKLALLFGPLFETFIFQFLIIEFIFFLFKKAWLSVIISGIIFGGAHYFNNYNITYTLLAIIAGFIFASIYVLAKKRKDVSPFLLVWVSHLFVNAVGFIPLIIRHFFK